MWALAWSASMLACAGAPGPHRALTADPRVRVPARTIDQGGASVVEVVAVEPPSYEALLEREAGATEPLFVVELGRGERRLHLVLDAGRCYRIVGVADASVSLELVDEHSNTLATGRGRVVRFTPICPRWAGSFELRTELLGERGQVSLRADQPSASSGSDPATRSITR